MALTDMVKRHAAAVLKVMEGQIAKHAGDLVAGHLPETCLVRLVTATEHLANAQQQTVAKLEELLKNGLPPVFQGGAPKNEKQVQDAVQGLLIAAGEKLQREVPLLGFAGIGTKPDFSQSNSKNWLFVELKYPAKRERMNPIVTEITSRAAIYRKQGACVLFPVYDPQHHITDVSQFIADCSVADQTWVMVIQ